jgi:hypothetical protein
VLTSGAVDERGLPRGSCDLNRLAVNGEIAPESGEAAVMPEMPSRWQKDEHDGQLS